MKIHNGNLELHVAEDGDRSAPPILLLHGITSFGGTWDWILPELTQRFRVLRLDFRGHGASDRASGEYTTDGYVSDAVAAIEQAAGAPCVVMGHSLGGATAAALAQRHTDLLVAAVMEDPPLGLAGNSAEGVLEGNSLLDSFRLMRESVPQLQAAGVSRDVLVGILSTAPTASGGTFGALLHPDGIAAMAGSLLAVDVAVLDPVLDGGIGAFLDPDAPFGVPSMILAADPSKPDAVADPTVARHFADISPATEVHVVEGAGHLIHDELVSRNEFRSVALDFIERATSTA